MDVTVFANLVMEVTPITLRHRSKSSSKWEIVQEREHKEMAIIRGYVRSCSSQIPETEPGMKTRLNRSVSRYFQEIHKQVCADKQTPAEENFGSVCGRDPETAHVGVVPVWGKRAGVFVPLHLPSLG